MSMCFTYREGDWYDAVGHIVGGDKALFVFNLLSYNSSFIIVLHSVFSALLCLFNLTYVQFTVCALSSVKHLPQ